MLSIIDRTLMERCGGGAGCCETGGMLMLEKGPSTG